MNSCVTVKEQVFRSYVDSLTSRLGECMGWNDQENMTDYINWDGSPQGSDYWSNYYDNDFVIINNDLIKQLHILLGKPYKNEPKVTGMCKFLTERGL